MEKAGCVLVDTDLFVNLYNINREWFTDVIDHEENPKNKKFYKTVANFYGDLKGADKESKVTFNQLNKARLSLSSNSNSNQENKKASNSVKKANDTLDSKKNKNSSDHWASING
jgi:hypothetical protein